MSDIITASITPAMIPGIRKAIEVCAMFAQVNCLIAFDQIETMCLTRADITREDMEEPSFYGAKRAAANEIADHLRALIGEGDAA